MAIMLICKRCGKSYQVKPYRKHTSHFCSKECTINRIIKKCGLCGKEFIVNKYREKTARYCSYKCLGFANEPNRIKANEACRGRPLSKAHKAKISKFMKGNKYGFKGRVRDGKYWAIYASNHPFCDNRKYVKEHRLVVEKHLGRYLDPTEQVHHINFNTFDNRLENLFVFENNSEHIIYHKLCKYNPFLKKWLKSNLI